MSVDPIPSRQVRAVHDEATITVYQAYSPLIADPALRHGRFVPPFGRGRMTWIKPSFLWMMYRCGWATKAGQERVLAVRITRAGLDWALTHSCLSHHDPELYDSPEEWAERKAAMPVRVQWDPERSLDLRPLAHRSLQVGIGGEAVARYVDEWIIELRDVTPLVEQIRAHLGSGDREAAGRLLPVEPPVVLSDAARIATGAS